MTGLTNPALKDKGLRAVASKDGEEEAFCFTSKGKKKFFLIKTTHGEANEDFFTGPVSGLLNHFLLFRCVSELEIAKLQRKSCLYGQLPASERAERTALSAGAEPALPPGHPRRERAPGDAAAPGGTGMGSEGPEYQRSPARAPAYPSVLMKPLTEPSAYRDTMSPM